MIKTSPIPLQNQTRPPQHQQEVATLGAAGQSPPLITGESGERNDQKAANDDGLLKLKSDEHGKKSNEENVCVIDIGNNVDEKDEKVCRICQLSCDQLPASPQNVNLVLLGCACKGDLAISHYHCAYAWFRQKGNRTCEICGTPAKNIEGIEDTGFRAFGSDIGVGIISSAQMATSSSSSWIDSRHRWTKALCNFMLAVFVMAFLIPWAIHPSKLFS